MWVLGKSYGTCKTNIYILTFVARSVRLCFDIVRDIDMIQKHIML